MIQLNLNILKDNIFFSNIKNIEFENIMIRSIICKIVFIRLSSSKINIRKDLGK